MGLVASLEWTFGVGGIGVSNHVMLRNSDAGLHVETSQNRIASHEQETTSSPSGEKATDVTGQLCPSIDSPICLNVKTSHSRTVLSHEPETICIPSGENATELTDDLCPLNDFPTCLHADVSHNRTVLSSEPETTFVPS